MKMSILICVAFALLICAIVIDIVSFVKKTKEKIRIQENANRVIISEYEQIRQRAIGVEEDYQTNKGERLPSNVIINRSESIINDTKFFDLVNNL